MLANYGASDDKPPCKPLSRAQNASRASTSCRARQACSPAPQRQGVCHLLSSAERLQVSVDVPDVKGRTEILKVHARNKKLAEEVSLDEIAQRTPGFSGADLANLLNEVRPARPAVSFRVRCVQSAHLHGLLSGSSRHVG